MDRQNPSHLYLKVFQNVSAFNVGSIVIESLRHLHAIGLEFFFRLLNGPIPFQESRVNRKLCNNSDSDMKLKK